VSTSHLESPPGSGGEILVDNDRTPALETVETAGRVEVSVVIPCLNEAETLVLGLLGYLLALPGTHVFGAVLDAHTLLFASLSILLGYQFVLFGMFTKAFAVTEGMLPQDPYLEAFQRVVTLERGALAGLAALAGGLALLGAAVWQWWAVDFGSLDYAYTMRWVIPGVTATTLGTATVGASFFMSILQMARREGFSR